MSFEDADLAAETVESDVSSGIVNGVSITVFRMPQITVRVLDRNGLDVQKDVEVLLVRENTGESIRPVVTFPSSPVVLHGMKPGDYIVIVETDDLSFIWGKV